MTQQVAVKIRRYDGLDLIIKDLFLVLYQVARKLTVDNPTFKRITFNIKFVKAAFTFPEPVLTNPVNARIRFLNLHGEYIKRTRLRWIDYAHGSHIYEQRNDDNCQNANNYSEYL